MYRLVWIFSGLCLLFVSGCINTPSKHALVAGYWSYAKTDDPGCVGWGVSYHDSSGGYQCYVHVETPDGDTQLDGRAWGTWKLEGDILEIHISGCTPVGIVPQGILSRDKLVEVTETEMICHSEKNGMVKLKRVKEPSERVKKLIDQGCTE